MLTFAIGNNKNNKAMENKLILSDYAQKVWNKVFSGYLIVIGGKSNYAPTLFFFFVLTLYSCNSELGEMQRDTMSREDFCQHIDNMISEGFKIVEIEIR